MDRKIKIAQVITRMDWGGSPDIVRILCRYLDTQKYDVWLIVGETRHPSGKTMEFLRKFRGRTVIIPQLKRDIEPIQDLLALAKLYLIFRFHKFDVVHTHTAKAGFLGRIAARLAGIKRIVHTPHGHNFYGYFGRMASAGVVMLEKFAASWADKTIVLTELEKKDLIECGVSKEGKIAVVRSGLELEAYRDAAIDAAKKKKELAIDDKSEGVVAMVGRLETVKGPEYFVEAAKIVLEKHPQVSFLLIGDGALKEKLYGRLTQLHIQDKCRLLGWREDIGEILAVLDIVVLPSLNEAVGRILLEAAMSKVPVVATNVGGIPEVVKDGETGILVKPFDAHALAGAIIVLLDNKERRLQMGQAARKWVANNFSARHMVEQISGIYERQG